MKKTGKIVALLTVFGVLFGCFGVNSFALSDTETTTIGGITATASSGYTIYNAYANTSHNMSSYKEAKVKGVYRIGNVIYHKDDYASNGGNLGVYADVTISGSVFIGVQGNHTVTYGATTWSPTTGSGLQP